MLCATEHSSYCTDWAEDTGLCSSVSSHCFSISLCTHSDSVMLIASDILLKTASWCWHSPQFRNVINFCSSSWRKREVHRVSKCPHWLRSVMRWKWQRRAFTSSLIALVQPRVPQSKNKMFSQRHNLQMCTLLQILLVTWHSGKRNYM